MYYRLPVDEIKNDIINSNQLIHIRGDVARTNIKEKT